MNYGILISCYVAIAGNNFGWVEGREIAEKGDKILFTAEGREAKYVNDNSCKYLEDPVAAYRKILLQKEANKATLTDAQKQVDKISTGTRPWCLVDADYGRRTCTYDTWEQCQRVARKGESCMERKLSL